MQKNLEKIYQIGLKFILLKIKVQKKFETQIDKGEASAIALATKYDDVLLIFDDLKARKLLKRLKFRIKEHSE